MRTGFSFARILNFAGNAAGGDRARDVSRGDGADALRRGKRAGRRSDKAPYRVGVIGAGSLGFHHIRILRDIGERAASPASSNRGTTVRTKSRIELGVKSRDP